MDMDGAKVISSTASKFSDGDGSLKFFLTLIIFPYERFPPPFVLYHFFLLLVWSLFSVNYVCNRKIFKTYFLFVCSANICNGSTVQNCILGWIAALLLHLNYRSIISKSVCYTFQGNVKIKYHPYYYWHKSCEKSIYLYFFTNFFWSECKLFMYPSKL